MFNEKSVLTGCILLLPTPGASLPSSDCRPCSEAGGGEAGDQSCRTLTKKSRARIGTAKDLCILGRKIYPCNLLHQTLVSPRPQTQPSPPGVPPKLSTSNSFGNLPPSYLRVPPHRPASVSASSVSLDLLHSLLPQPRPPFFSASALSPSPTPSLPSRISSALRSPIPPARPRPAPAARRVLTVVVVTDFPPGALSLRHLAASCPSRQSVRQPSRPRLRTASDQEEGRFSSPPRPSPPGLTYSRAARAPLQPIS